jgi:endonuclease III
MNKKTIIQQLVNWQGLTYASELNINLSLRDKNEIFKWFLAAILFGARISENTAKKTYFRFKEYELTTPQNIIQAGWDRLVQVLDAGGYVRYDFKTADKLLIVMQNLLHTYGDDLNKMHQQSENSEDLMTRLQTLGKGIGPVTVQIFLRELRMIWEKAQPPLSFFSILCIKNLALLKEDLADNEIIIKKLLEMWKKAGKSTEDFPVFETALLRVGKGFCQKNACTRCTLKTVCIKAI